ncbi:hypothetical protein L6R46_19710 [Myxococcota bacterium]|nr:hypothetical protein [Myxococcota bacterium]
MVSPRSLLSRLRARLTPKVGERRLPQHEDALSDWAAQGEGTFQFIAAAVVGAWEVGLAELAREARQTRPPAEAAAFVERCSDALVPTLTPVQGAGKRLEKAMLAGLTSQTGRLLDVVAPAVATLLSLGAELEVGWHATADYVAPLFPKTPEGQAALRRLREEGAHNLARAFDEPAAQLKAQYGALAEATDLSRALGDPLEAYRMSVTLALELTLSAQREALLVALRGR